MLQDLCVLTKAGWSPRALRHLSLSMVLFCTSPEDYTYRHLQQCSCTPAFMVHSIGQLKILSKVPLISQVTSKAQLPRNACEELSTRPLPPNMPSRSEEQRRRKGGPQNSSWRFHSLKERYTGPTGVQTVCIHRRHMRGQRSPVHLQRCKHHM